MANQFKTGYVFGVFLLIVVMLTSPFAWQDLTWLFKAGTKRKDFLGRFIHGNVIQLIKPGQVAINAGEGGS